MCIHHVKVRIALLLMLTLQTVASFSQNNSCKRIIDSLIDFNAKQKTDRLIYSVNNNTIIDEKYRGNYHQLYSLYSITKLVSALSVGILWEKRLIKHPDEKLVNFFPSWRGDSLKEKITIRHILQHTSGLSAAKGSGDIYPQKNFVSFALETTVINEPGTTFFYNNKAYNIISGLIKQITNLSLEQFIKQNLFNPLEITDYQWKHDESGNTWAMDGLYLSADNLYKLGELINNKGKWNNQIIIGEKWFDMMFQLPINNFKQNILGYGLGVKIRYFKDEFFIKNSTINSYISAGLPEKMIDRLKELAEIKFPDWMSLATKMLEKFNSYEIEQLNSLSFSTMMPLYHCVNEHIIAMHGGEYGLLLAACPSKKMVTVRMIGEKWGRTYNKDGSYKYFIDNDLLIGMVKLINCASL